MMPDKPRGVERHMAMFAAYGASIKALPPAAWERLSKSCEPLEGDSFAMVVRRARFAAQAHEVFESIADNGHARMISSAMRATTVTLGVAGELVSELVGPSTGPAPGMLSRIDPKRATYARGWIDMEGAIATANPSVGVMTAVRAAGAALIRHDWLTPARFAAIYNYVELEVPYATVERDADNQ